MWSTKIFSPKDGLYSETKGFRMLVHNIRPLLFGLTLICLTLTMELHALFLLTSKMLKHNFKEGHLTFQLQNLLFPSILKLAVQLLDILSHILQLMQVPKLIFLSKWKQ